VLANTDDNSCISVVIGCMDATMFNYNSLANTSSGNCIPFIYGCIDSTQFNYDPLANTDNATCIPFIYGCNDVASFNYNPLANTSDNSCCYIDGCTDPSALNYDPNACFDNNSCVTIITGCTEVGAYNYDPLANVSDSTSCLYEAIGCVTGLGDPFGTGYWLNDGCFAWVIDVDEYCCTNSWDVSCQSMYDYCQLGWPVGIDDLNSKMIIVYPNPSKDVFNIETRLDVEVKVYDLSGRMIIQETSKRISLEGYPSGVYNMSIIYNKLRINKRIIKQ